MPLAASVKGTLTRVAAGGTAATGTLSVIGYATGAAAGTLDIDRTLFLAFYSRVRLTRPDVYVGGYLMPNLVDTVELDESIDSPIQYATFTLSDKRVAYFDAASLSNGQRDVAVDLWAGPPGAVLPWLYAFVGDTETSTNTMPYRPRGQFRAVSRSARWADVLGCINVPAMSGLRRGAILAAFAESAGVTIANAASLGGAVVTKRLDIAGVTPFQLIQEFGEIEGWIPRFVRIPMPGAPSIAGLEILSEDTILDGEPVFAFDESNTFDVPETCPDRPVTDWILSTTQVTTDPKGGVVTTITSSPGIDANTVIESTTDSGVEIKRVETTWAKVITPGETLTDAVYQITNRVTIESNWEPFYFVDGVTLATRRIISTLLNSRRTTTETLMGVPSSNGLGYEWDGGGWFTTHTASLMVAEILDEVFTWNADCSPRTSLVERQRYYSPLALTGYTYTDGSIRSGSTYVWYPGSIIGYPDSYISSGQAATHSLWIDLTEWPTDWFLTSWGALYQVQVATNLPVEAQGVGRLTSWRLRQASAGVETFGELTGWQKPAAISPMAKTTDLAPGSATQPQASEEVIVAEYDATDASGYPRRTESPALLMYPENVAELNAIAKRRLRRAFSDTLDIPHNAIPFLRVGDHVSVTNHARSLVNADAYVTAIKRTCNVTNGAFRQVTTVKIPPSWI
jgi:hypothetical protein